MKGFESYDLDTISEGYINIVKYVVEYFPYQTIEPRNLWMKVFLLRNDIDKVEWKAALRVIEIGLCCPQSNAALERFFSQFKFIKTNIRSRLNSDNMNALIRIKVTGPTIQEFHENYSEKCVNRWYNSTKRRPNQKKRKIYKPRQPRQKSVSSIISSSTSSDSSDSSSSNSSSED